MRSGFVRPINGRHVLAGLVAAFGLVLLANGTFVYLALSSWTGLSTDDPYRRGLAYNETLAAAAAQRALGWRAEIEATPTGGGTARIAARFVDRRARPLEDLTVTATLRRPTHEGYDRTFALPHGGAGRYAAEAALPLNGQWEVRIEARSPQGSQFEARERVWLR